MRRFIASVSISMALFGPGFTATSVHAQPRAEPLPSPRYTIVLGGRDACVTPSTRNRARADGGIIDVQTPSPSSITVAMTGAPAADSYLGCTSTATQTFHLVQEFEISCSNPAVDKVSLSLDSSLLGYVRSMRNAGAAVRLAAASVVADSWSGPPLELAHPPLHAERTEGRLCNQHLPPIKGPPMPLGHYTLVADFVLDTTASGVCNAHAAADFSPDTSLPTEWVRTRDPFQGVSKKSFGFNLTLTAEPPADSDRTPASGSRTQILSPLRASAGGRQSTSAAMATARTQRQAPLAPVTPATTVVHP